MTTVQIEKQYAIEECAAKDGIDRPHYSVYLDRSRLVATDGHILASVPVVVDEPEDGRDKDKTAAIPPARGLLPAEAIKEARKRAKRGHPGVLVVQDREAVIPGGPSYPRPDPKLVFPRYEEIVPKESLPGREGYVTFSIDVALLARCCKAIGTEKVTIVMHPNISDLGIPAMIFPNAYLDSKQDLNGPFAILMPLRNK